jgi:hypothetical protein
LALERSRACLRPGLRVLPRELAAHEHRQVHAGAEVLAGAAEHDDACAGLVADAGHDLGQLAPEVGVIVFSSSGGTAARGRPRSAISTSKQ